MNPIESERLRRIEGDLGAPVPESVRLHLSAHTPVREGGFGFELDGELWEVRNTFVLDATDERRQVDAVYSLVADALPPGLLPLADDWAGNFYCISLIGANAGHVVYWEHERDIGDEAVHVVAGSLPEFMVKLHPISDSGA